MKLRKTSQRGEPVLMIPVTKPAACPRCGQVPLLFRLQDEFQELTDGRRTGERFCLRWWFECICKSSCEMPTEWQALDKWTEHVEAES